MIQPSPIFIDKASVKCLEVMHFLSTTTQLLNVLFPVDGELFPASLVVSQPPLKAYLYDLSAGYSSVSDGEPVLCVDQMALFKTKLTPSAVQLWLCRYVQFWMISCDFSLRLRLRYII